jgi:hypothetical protein
LRKTPKHYKTEEDYGSALLLQLANWTAHPERLNRGESGSMSNADYVAEQLTTGIASVQLGAETGINSYQTKHFERFIPEWISMIKTEPAVLSKAVNAAQKITDYILEMENKLGLRKDIAQKPRPLDLFIGDEIKYNETTYKVIESMKGGKLKIEDMNNGAKLPIAPTDGLYRSLVHAKYRGDAVASEVKNEQSESNAQGIEIQEEQSENRVIKR